jgi:FkbM family methyltransferase
MLISLEKIKEWIKRYDIDIQGVLHIGAHECEELPFYIDLLKDPKKVFWIDAMHDKVEFNTQRGIPNVYQAVVSNKNGETVKFNISNNGQSSSILEFGTHLTHHNWVYYTKSVELQTITIDTFLEKNSIDPTKLTFWNLDIQGAELLALQGAEKALEYPNIIYLEVNTEEVYKGCGLLSQIDSLLLSKGFQRVEIEMTYAGWGDAMYIRMA